MREGSRSFLNLVLEAICPFLLLAPCIACNDNVACFLGKSQYKPQYQKTNMLSPLIIADDEYIVAAVEDSAWQLYYVEYSTHILLYFNELCYFLKNII
jgi:hypothetical protein